MTTPQSGVSTALPTIVDDLHGSDFIWAGSAYSIASTAVLPLIGGLVSMFGRKPILLVFVLVFALGSALCGAAQSMDMLIGGRGTFLAGSTWKYLLTPKTQSCRASVAADALQSRRSYTPTWYPYLNEASSRASPPCTSISITHSTPSDQN